MHNIIREERINETLAFYDLLKAMPAILRFDYNYIMVFTNRFSVDFKLYSRHLFLQAFFIATFLAISHVYAQDTIGSSIDCTDVSVHFSDNAQLTREERLELMDKALFNSLNKFELCHSALNGNGSSANSGGGGKAGDNGQGAAGGDAGNGGNPGESGASKEKSVASTGISGTEPPKTSKISDQMAESGAGASSMSQDESGKTASSGGKKLNSGSGKLPDDIPAAANDDALAAQIRYAAENETDPVKKAQLWDEYRKYKGLPAKQ